MNERLEKLETSLAFLEKQYDELNEVVTAQNKRIARLEAELTRASDALATAELERIRADSKRPPHYQ